MYIYDHQGMTPQEFCDEFNKRDNMEDNFSLATYYWKCEDDLELKHKVIQEPLECQVRYHEGN